MTEPVSRCPQHGFAAGSACPRCGHAAERVLDGDRRRRLSKFVSGALRHFPGDAGLDPDPGGWVEYEELAAAVSDQYGWAGPEELDALLATDPKGRFERRGRRVRAAYGHSIDVDLDGSESGGSVPDRLYHGTAPGNLDSIRREGLKPMSRQSVHLSETREEAREVGRRHAADPAVLAVDAARLLADGWNVAKRGRATYTVDRVPPEYVEFP